VLLTGAGPRSSLLYNKWFQVYQKDTRTRVAYDAVGSGRGIRRFMGKAAKRTSWSISGASRRGHEGRNMTQVKRACSPAPYRGQRGGSPTHPRSWRRSQALRKAYTGIFLGEITKWNDPLIARSNPGVKLPKISIATVVRQDSSGTDLCFTKHLDAISGKWRSLHGPATLVNWAAARCARRATKAWQPITSPSAHRLRGL